MFIKMAHLIFSAILLLDGSLELGNLPGACWAEFWKFYSPVEARGMKVLRLWEMSRSEIDVTSCVRSVAPIRNFLASQKTVNF